MTSLQLTPQISRSHTLSSGPRSSAWVSPRCPPCPLTVPREQPELPLDHDAHLLHPAGTAHHLWKRTGSVSAWPRGLARFGPHVSSLYTSHIPGCPRGSQPPALPCQLPGVSRQMLAWLLPSCHWSLTFSVRLLSGTCCSRATLPLLPWPLCVFFSSQHSLENGLVYSFDLFPVWLPPLGMPAPQRQDLVCPVLPISRATTGLGIR